MRHYTQLFFSFPTNSECDTDCYNQNFGSEQIIITSASPYSFISCSWDGCLGEPAGAISCFQSGASLTISGCTFLHCYSTSFENPEPHEEYNGGAICVVGITACTVSSSSFIKCCAPQTGNDNGGSGGIYGYDIKTTISLSFLDFISCFTGTSAAGAYFESIKASAVGPQTVINCRFIDCKAEGNTPDGGGFTCWNSDYTMGCSNSLFMWCSAGSGGGIDFTFNQNPDSHPIRFCFFRDNVAPFGNDIRLRNYTSSNPNPLLHCFSTTQEFRDNIVYIDASRCYNDNWLPHDNMNHKEREFA